MCLRLQLDSPFFSLPTFLLISYFRSLLISRRPHLYICLSLGNINTSTDCAPFPCLMAANFVGLQIEAVPAIPHPLACHFRTRLFGTSFFWGRWDWKTDQHGEATGGETRVLPGKCTVNYWYLAFRLLLPMENDYTVEDPVFGKLYEHQVPKLATIPNKRRWDETTSAAQLILGPFPFFMPFRFGHA